MIGELRTRSRRPSSPASTGQRVVVVAAAHDVPCHGIVAGIGERDEGAVADGEQRVAAQERLPQGDVPRRRRAGDRCPVLDDDPQPDGPPRRLGRPVDHALDRPAGPDDPPRDRAGAVVHVLDLARAGQRERVLACRRAHRPPRAMGGRSMTASTASSQGTSSSPSRTIRAAGRKPPTASTSATSTARACSWSARTRTSTRGVSGRPSAPVVSSIGSLGLLRPRLRPVTERERPRHHDAELEPHAVLRRAGAVRVEQVALVEHRVGDPLDGLERHAGCTSRAGAASAAAPSSGSAAPCPASSSSRSTASSQEVTAWRPL